MAETIHITGVPVKIRRPWGVFLLYLNRLWRHVQSEEEKRSMGMRGEPMARPPVR
jgi:hypothetical protein